MTIHNELHAASGYWFVAPYGFLVGSPPTAKWEPCQIGPHVYAAYTTSVGFFTMTGFANSLIERKLEVALLSPCATRKMYESIGLFIIFDHAVSDF